MYIIYNIIIENPNFVYNSISLVVDLHSSLLFRLANCVIHVSLFPQVLVHKNDIFQKLSCLSFECLFTSISSFNIWQSRIFSNSLSSLHKYTVASETFFSNFQCRLLSLFTTLDDALVATT